MRRVDVFHTRTLQTFTLPAMPARLGLLLGRALAWAAGPAWDYDLSEGA